MAPSPSTPQESALYESSLPGLRRIHQGKVRDIYAVDDEHLLIVSTDRLSAFDVVLPDPIPDKGRILNRISEFWFARTGHIVPNHVSDRSLDSLPIDAGHRQLLRGRAMIVRRVQPLPVEAVVRGYLIGSGWRDYQRSGQVCGLSLPPGLRQAEALPTALFTPATKAPVGEHDQNISFAQLAGRIGSQHAEAVRDHSLALYHYAAEHARRRGILIADTKFEFGIDASGRLLLIDELLTPDSSRFWPAEGWSLGTSPPSFDKQYLRDYLETLPWDKRAPGPHLPAEIIERTRDKYLEALRRLTGPESAA